MSNWLTYSPTSGHGNGTITITADTLSTLEDRVATIIVSNSQYSLSASTSVTQKGAQLTAITFENLTWVTDVPASGGTATKDNCSYTVIGQYANGNTGDITEYVTVSGSLNIPVSTEMTRHSAGTLTLTATYNGLTGTTSVTVYQEAAPKYIINITFDNLTWVSDIPASGGTGDSANCSYSIYANYSDGTSVDVTSISTVSGSLTVPSTTIGERQNVGTLTLTAQYLGFTTTGDVIAYQEAYVPTPTPSIPLTFEIISGGDIFWKSNNSEGKTISFSKNDGDWVEITSSKAGTQINVSTGDVIKFKGDNSKYSNSFSSSTGTKFNVRGNIMSLIDSDGFATAKTLTDSNTFYSLFSGCTGLVSAENLLLPATTLAYYCYHSMFDGCTSLTTAPDLPATTLANGCYIDMFKRCKSLTTAPELPATTLANSCYDHMFNGCTSLTTAPALPATTLADYCYTWMFAACTSLKTAPALPATTLARECYNEMFFNCTSLTIAPELPATTLARDCYYYMFADCTSLTTAPSILPATALVPYCYGSMFKRCTSLITAPELPATTLVEGCYEYMFDGCTSLNYIKCLATKISATDCTKYWVADVSSTGTFVKNPNKTWTKGVDGIPKGWTVTNAS